MAITSTRALRWYFKAGLDKQELPDPRIPIVRHIQWQPPQYTVNTRGLTTWSTPEPDAYNYAFLADRPIECPFLENQIWYYHEHLKKWFSVYYVPNEKKLTWARWFIHQPWLAHWTVFKESQLRRTRPLLMQEKRKTKHEDPTLNERLHELNFYSSLLNKSEESIRDAVKERIGGIA